MVGLGSRAKQWIDISQSQYDQEQYPNHRSCKFLVTGKYVTTSHYKWSIVALQRLGKSFSPGVREREQTTAKITSSTFSVFLSVKMKQMFPLTSGLSKIITTSFLRKSFSPCRHLYNRSYTAHLGPCQGLTCSPGTLPKPEMYIYRDVWDPHPPSLFIPEPSHHMMQETDFFPIWQMQSRFSHGSSFIELLGPGRWKVMRDRLDKKRPCWQVPHWIYRTFDSCLKTARLKNWFMCWMVWCIAFTIPGPHQTLFKVSVFVYPRMLWSEGSWQTCFEQLQYKSIRGAQ